MGCELWLLIIALAIAALYLLSMPIAGLMQLEGINPNNFGGGLALYILIVLIPLELWWLFLILIGSDGIPEDNSFIMRVLFAVEIPEGTYFIERIFFALAMLVSFAVADAIIVQLCILLPF